MNDRAQKIIDYIAMRELAGENDYTSHQEYADDLMKALYNHALSNKEATDQELVDLVHSTMRRKDWYEFAVLRDLGIGDENKAFRLPYLKRWRLQAYMFEGKPIPYNFLVNIAYSWSEKGIANNHKAFQPNEIPSENPERNAPSKPKWLETILKPFPDTRKEQEEFSVEFLKAFFAVQKKLDVKFSRYFLACNEPDLNLYNAPVIRDMCKNLSPDEFDKRVEHYAEVLDACQEALDETSNTMNSTLDIVETWLMNEVSKDKRKLTEKMIQEIEEAEGEDMF